NPTTLSIIKYNRPTIHDSTPSPAAAHNTHDSGNPTAVPARRNPDTCIVRCNNRSVPSQVVITQSAASPTAPNSNATGRGQSAPPATAAFSPSAITPSNSMAGPHISASGALT